MGQGERIEIFTHCPLTPSLKRSLNPQGIKKSLNLNLKSITIFAAVSLIVILTTALVTSWMLFEHYMGTPIDPPTVAEYFNGLVVHPGFWFSYFIEIIILGAGWKLLSEVREFSKTNASSTLVGEERGERKRGEERKLKHLKTTFLVVLLIVIGVAMTPQFAETAGEDSSIMNLGEASSIRNLEGLRIWIFGEEVPDPPVYTISADEYAYVRHGWNSKGQYYSKINWSELSELEKNEFIETSTFELTINGIPIELSCAQWLDSELDVYYIIYYIQFKPGELATGNHTFSGTWYSEVNGNPYTDESGTCPITKNVTVNVV